MTSVAQALPDTKSGIAAQLPIIAIAMACFTFATCYFRFFIFPNVPLLPGSDQVMAANDGVRIAAGQLPYRDFFEFLPAGSPLTYAALVKIFGVRIWIPGLVTSFLAATVALLVTLAAGRILRGAIAILPALLFTGFILVPSADTAHHWFSTVLVLSAMLVLFGELTLPRIALAGTICGLAGCYTQTKGATAVLGFAAYLIWRAKLENSPKKRTWLRCLFLCGTALAVFAAVNAYFISSAGLNRWFFWLVVYPWRYYSVPEINNWHIIPYEFWRSLRGVSTGIAYVFLSCTVPLVYFVFLFFRYRGRKTIERTESDERLILVTLTGLAMFLAIAQAPSLIRLGTVSPPAMILVAALLDRAEKSYANFPRMVTRGLGTLALAVAMASVVRTQSRRIVYADLPSGKAAFTDSSLRDEYAWISEHTHPGQPFWGLATLYFPFQLQHTTPLEQLCSCDYTRPEDVARLVTALEEVQVPTIIIPSQTKYPMTEKTHGNHLMPFVQYLYTHYRLTSIFGTGDEVWEKIGATVGR